MWFASMSTADQYPWAYNLVWKLLHNDPGAVGLFANTPFPGKRPRFIRAILYRYKFVRPGNPQGLYWTREQIGDWIPAVSVNDSRLLKYLEYQGWVK
jgi:hypothetical protein